MPVPEVGHFLDRVDADGVDEVDVPVPSAGFPLGQLAADEGVEGELAGHDAFLARVLGHLAEVGGGFGGVGAGRGGGGVFVLAVEGDVRAAGDVEVEGVRPTV